MQKMLVADLAAEERDGMTTRLPGLTQAFAQDKQLAQISANKKLVAIKNPPKWSAVDDNNV